jgi:hypothetical protein
MSDTDRDMEEIARMVERMEREPHPYRDLLVHLMRSVNDVSGVVNAIGDRWRHEYLLPAVAHDKANPVGQDYENYSNPLLGTAEILRMQFGFKDLAHRISLKAVELTDRHCVAPGPDLHRGALYANLGITYLERRQFELGLSWLLAAAKEDVRFNRVPDVYGSHAMSDIGIYGQWVAKEIMPVLAPGVLDFVNGRLGTVYGFPDVMRVLRSLAGNGDLNLLAGIVNFSDVEGRNDYMAHSVRFTSLRDLATLSEVLLKRIGAAHTDAAVRAKYANEQMMGGMIHHMHYQHGPRHANVALRAVRSAGLFWNSIQQQNNIIAGIDAGFDSVKSAGGLSVADVRAYLHGTLLSADPNADALAKHYLLAYRLRNETSHSFRPEDSGVVAHATEFRIWLLQTIFYAYFWFHDSGQAVL